LKLLKSLQYAGLAGLALSSSLAMASLTFDADGSGGDAAVQVDAFDWRYSSFLAENGTLAISNWLTTYNSLVDDNTITGVQSNAQTFLTESAIVTATCGEACEITVYTHATLGETTVGSDETSPAGLGSDYEITLVTSFTETVSAVVAGGITTYFDVVTEKGATLEMYYDDLSDADDGTLAANNLLGSGFNDGKLILSGTTILDSTGSFSVDFLADPVDLDQSPAGDDDYPTIDTIIGNGSQGAIVVGGFTLDPDHFLTELESFTLAFANISQQLPFVSADPSECFTQTFGETSVGGTQTQTKADCDQLFDDEMGTADSQGGLTPVIGTLNGLGVLAGGGKDFIAQTDFNSPVTGIPSPAPLALMSIGLLGLGLFGRKKAKHAA